MDGRAGLSTTSGGQYLCGNSCGGDGQRDGTGGGTGMGRESRGGCIGVDG